MGTNDGPFGEIPTSNSMEVTGITIDRFEDGKIVESCDQWDNLGLM